MLFLIFLCSKAANRILQQVNSLNKKLSDARDAQNSSISAIDLARSDIEASEESLKAVSNTNNDSIV